MFSLSQASYDTKEILKWGGILIAAMVVIVVVIQMFLMVKNALYPSPPPKPTLAFGKLDAQLFPDNATKLNLSYKINTLTGYLPTLPSQVKIYKLKNPAPDLLDLTNASTKLSATDFKNSPTKVSDTIYQWSNTTYYGLTQNINMNIVNYNFTLNSDFLSSPSALAGDLSDESICIKDATDFLSKINGFPSDIDTSKTQTSLFSIQNGQLITSTSLADAQVVRVDFFQKDVDNIPVVYERPDQSTMNFMIGPSDQIVNAQYVYQTPSNQAATYPIISSQTAFANLQKGNAYIASYDSTATNVTITDAFIAYYISSAQQRYLMPVIVFEGSGNFTAYLPAVTGEWINK
jgi:hypothetical protein